MTQHALFRRTIQNGEVRCPTNRVTWTESMVGAELQIGADKRGSDKASAFICVDLRQFFMKIYVMSWFIHDRDHRIHDRISALLRGDFLIKFPTLRTRDSVAAAF